MIRMDWLGTKLVFYRRPNLIVSLLNGESSLFRAVSLPSIILTLAFCFLLAAILACLYSLTILINLMSLITRRTLVIRPALLILMSDAALDVATADENLLTTQPISKSNEKVDIKSSQKKNEYMYFSLPKQDRIISVEKLIKHRTVNP